MFKNYSKSERRKFPFVALMLLFPILQFLVFYVYVNFNTFVLAFTNVQGSFSVANFEEIFREWSNPSLLSLRGSLARSIITWSISTFIVFPMTILFTYALYKKVKGEMIFRVIFFLPSILGSVVMSTLFRYLLDGPISELLFNWGWISEELYQMGFFYGGVSFKTVIFYGCWIGLCGNIVVLTGAMSRIPTEVLEYAKLDGIGFFREFFQITLPLIWPTISTLLIYSLPDNVGLWNQSYLVTNNSFSVERFQFTTTIADGANPNLVFGARVQGESPSYGTYDGLVYRFYNGFYETYYIKNKQSNTIGAKSLALTSGVEYTFDLCVTTVGGTTSTRLIVKQGETEVHNKTITTTETIPATGRFAIWSQEARTVKYEINQ